MYCFLLILFLFAVPSLIGAGLRQITELLPPLQSRRSTITFPVSFSFGLLLMLLSAGVVHLSAVFCNLSLSSAAKIYAVVLLILATIGYALRIVEIIRKNLKDLSSERNTAAPAEDKDAAGDSVLSRMLRGKADLAAFGILLLVTILMIILLLGHKGALVSGDQMAETVASFLRTDCVYSVNPLTGAPYTAGVPTHYRILFLPTFYAILARTFHLSAVTVTWSIMPVYWLICSLIIMYGIGLSLRLSGHHENKAFSPMVFTAACAVLLFFLNSARGLPGYELLSYGYRPTVVRLLVLIPMLVGSLIDKRLLSAVLVCMLEALLIWTRFGTGLCLLLLVLFVISGVIYRGITKGGSVK